VNRLSPGNGEIEQPSAAGEICDGPLTALLRRRRREDRPSAPLVPHDVEALLLGWRLKVGSDGVELRIRGPASVGGQVLASILELTFARAIRGIDEMQLVLNLRAL
jgi:hypothetical protein